MIKSQNIYHKLIASAPNLQIKDDPLELRDSAIPPEETPLEQTAFRPVSTQPCSPTINAEGYRTESQQKKSEETAIEELAQKIASYFKERPFLLRASTVELPSHFFYNIEKIFKQEKQTNEPWTVDKDSRTSVVTMRRPSSANFTNRKNLEVPGWVSVETGVSDSPPETPAPPAPVKEKTRKVTKVVLAPHVMSGGTEIKIGDFAGEPLYVSLTLPAIEGEKFPKGSLTGIHEGYIQVETASTNFIERTLFPQGIPPKVIEMKLSHLASLWCYGTGLRISQVASVANLITALFAADDPLENIPDVEMVKKITDQLKKYFLGTAQPLDGNNPSLSKFDILCGKIGLPLYEWGKEARTLLPNETQRQFTTLTVLDYLESLVEETNMNEKHSTLQNKKETCREKLEKLVNDTPEKTDLLKTLESIELKLGEIEEEFTKIRKRVGAPYCVIAYILELMERSDLFIVEGKLMDPKSPITSDTPPFVKLVHLVCELVVNDNDIASFEKETRDAWAKIDRRIIETPNQNKHTIIKETLLREPPRNQILVNLKTCNTLQEAATKLATNMNKILKSVDVACQHYLSISDTPEDKEIIKFLFRIILGVREWGEHSGRYTTKNVANFAYYNTSKKRSQEQSDILAVPTTEKAHQRKSSSANILFDHIDLTS